MNIECTDNRSKDNIENINSKEKISNSKTNNPEDINSNKNKEPNFKFFSHTECEYFPCHKVKDKESFNCLFCYCPLYLLGDKCGGNFTYTKDGTKDCSNCLVPHRKENYDYIVEKLQKHIFENKKQ